MVQHTRTAEMDQEYAALKEAFVQTLTAEDLALLLPEERLAGLAPEERLAGLSREERSRLFQQLCKEGFTPPGEPPRE